MDLSTLFEVAAGTAERTSAKGRCTHTVVAAYTVVAVRTAVGHTVVAVRTAVGHTVVAAPPVAGALQAGEFCWSPNSFSPQGQALQGPSLSRPGSSICRLAYLYHPTNLGHDPASDA